MFQKIENSSSWGSLKPGLSISHRAETKMTTQLSPLLSLPRDILVAILQYLDLSDLVRLESQCRYLKDLIRQTPWDHISINELSDACHHDDNIMSRYRVTNYFYCPNLTLTDEMLGKMAHCKSLILDGAEDISDDGVLRLRNCDFLSIDGCEQLTDKCLKIFENRRFSYLCISNCTFTGEGFCYLRYCAEIDLSDCEAVTDQALQYLENCPKIRLAGCSITDNGLRYLGRCRELDLSYCDKVTDQGLLYLVSCEVLTARYCHITDRSLENLKYLRYLDLSGCQNINGRGIQYLVRCQVLNLSFCGITDENAKYLVRVPFLNLSHCTKLTKKSLKSLALCYEVNLTDCLQIPGQSITKWLKNCHRVILDDRRHHISLCLATKNPNLYPHYFGL